MMDKRTLVCIIALFILGTSAGIVQAQSSTDPLLGRDGSDKWDNQEQQPQAQQKPTPPKQQPQPAQPKPEDKKRKIEIYAGPDVGVFVPTSSKTKSRFGSSWFGYGIDLGSISAAKDKGSFYPNLSIISQSNNNDYAYFALLGVEYRRSFLKSRRSTAAPQDNGPKDQKNDKVAILPRPRFVPYYGLTADFAVGDLRSIEDNVHAGVRTGAAAGLSLGVTYKNNSYLEARYRETTVIKGFDLSGFSVSAGYRFKL